MKPKKLSIRASWKLLAAIAVAIYLSVLLIQIVKRNYDLTRQVADLKQQIDLLQTEKEELGYKISYYQTDSYKEKAARAKLGLQAPGENVIILPKTPSSSTANQTAKTTPKKPNWQQWMDFFFGPSQ